MFLCLSWNLFTSQSFAEEKSPAIEPMVVRYVVPTGREFLHAYKVELIHQALEITRPEFGNYEVMVFKGESPNDQRRTVLINEGKLINLLWSTPGSVISKGEVLEIPVDIFHGLLGYRVCLKHSAAPPMIKVNSLQGLMKIKIGQSEEWPDVKIYKANRVKPVLTPGLSSLFDMLGYRRFDCLPLGATEVTHVYEEKKKQYPFLVIDDQLLIYYRFPIYFYISKNQPDVARRIALGFKKLKENGDFDRIFRQYHEEDLKVLNLRKRHMVCLESPYIDEVDQCKKPIQYPDQWLD